MLHWIGGLVSSLGYGGVCLLMALENIILPLPSEVIMPLAGFEAALGRMSLVGAILAGAIGGVVGAFPFYWLARHYGQERLGRWVEAHGAWMFLHKRDIDRAAERFERGDMWAVFISQLLPGVRGLISLPAGFASMNFALFTLANFLGTLVWCAVLATLGHLLGRNYGSIHRILGPLGWALLAALFVGGVAYLIVRQRRYESRS